MTYLRISLFFFFICCSQILFAQSPRTASLNVLNSVRNSSVCDSTTMFAGTSEQALVLGSQSNDVQFLCLGDSLEITHNGGQILDADPIPSTQAGISYVFYDCQPYLSEDNITDIALDSCITSSAVSPGFYLDGIADSLGNAIFANNGSLQNFFNNGGTTEHWFAPITVHDHDNLVFELNSSFEDCINLNKDDAFRVVYLNSIEITVLGANMFVIKGGLPEFDNSDYNISIVLQDDISITGTVDNAFVSHGDTISVSVPEGGVYVINIEDGKSCGFTDSYLLSPSGNFTSFEGTVYWDVIGDCMEDVGNVPLANWIVEFTNLDNGEITYSSTDSLGEYSYIANALDYDVRLIPYNELWGTCVETQTVSATTGQNTVLAPFLTSGINPCPQLEVNIAASNLTRCFNETYYINYCNSGTAIAQNASVEITFDEGVVVNSSSVPWTSQNGNTYTFEIGNINLFECGDFEVFVSLDCNISLGEVICSQALIFPNDSCDSSSPSWDMSSIFIEGFCVLDDFIIFNVNNVGEDMATSREWRLYSNDTLIEQGTFLLFANTSFEHTVVANGNTFRFEADQDPFYPGNSQPYLTVESCGMDENGNHSTGFVNIFPEDDTELFVSTFCDEVVGSFDPNDKMAFPKGYGVEHFIEANTSLEYIIRFQNTGTAPAVNIVVKDTLSELLDPTSIQLGASSHPYEFSLLGEGILTFAFDDIMLPDSSTNLEASQGFISFRINQKQNNAIGSIIENEASIYFDFNEPIVTNTVFHTIGEDFIEENLSTSNSYLVQENLVEVSPNPFSDFTYFNVKGNHTQVELTVYDMTGRVIHQQKTSDSTFSFSKNNLPTGIYYYQVNSEGTQIGRGKIMIR